MPQRIYCRGCDELYAYLLLLKERRHFIANDTLDRSKKFGYYITCVIDYSSALQHIYYSCSEAFCVERCLSEVTPREFYNLIDKSNSNLQQNYIICCNGCTELTNAIEELNNTHDFIRPLYGGNTSIKYCFLYTDEGKWRFDETKSPLIKVVPVKEFINFWKEKLPLKEATTRIEVNKSTVETPDTLEESSKINSEITLRKKTSLKIII